MGAELVYLLLPKRYCFNIIYTSLIDRGTDTHPVSTLLRLYLTHDYIHWIVYEVQLHACGPH